MRQFNWTRANEVAGPGTFVLTAIILLIMVWPMIKPASRADAPLAPNKDFQKVEEPRKTNNVPWIMPSILAVALIIAGFVHYKAAMVARSAPNIASLPQQPSSALATSSQPPPDPTALVESPSLQPGRVMANATSQELLAIYRNNTTIQAERLSERYIGTWMKVSGRPVRDVGIDGDIPRVVISAEAMNIAIIGCYFTKEWKQQVSVINKGNKVSVTGKIAKFDALTIRLEECELS